MELFSQIKINNKLQGKLGLKNYGDSSFVNAIVQSISNLEPVCFAIRSLLMKHLVRLHCRILNVLMLFIVVTPSFHLNREMPFDLPKSIGSIEDAVERTKRM